MPTGTKNKPSPINHEWVGTNQSTSINQPQLGIDATGFTTFVAVLPAHPRTSGRPRQREVLHHPQPGDLGARNSGSRFGARMRHELGKIADMIYIYI